MTERTPTTPPAPRSEAPVSALQWIALGGLLIASLLPASAGADLFPYWDLDPTRNWVPPTGLGPAAMLGLVTLSLLSAGLAMVAESRRGGAISVGQIVLAAIGSLGVVAHTVFDGTLHEGAGDGIEHAVKAAPWLALVWGAVGVSHLCRDRRVRTVALAVLAGFAVPLLAKGVLQVFVDHPATLAQFDRTKEAVFESKGWLQDSPAALAYERRLSQAEASGWFGLSNVYASFMGAITAGLLAACASSVSRTRRVSRATLIGLGVAACALAGLLLSKSKGGLGAMGLSLALCAGFAVLRRWKPRMGCRLGGFVGPAAIVLVLGAVGVRGLIGTDLAEKSLLFRAFYAVGSLRIWGDAPVFGVGPDGFQDAYAAAKIPIATETVQSPHSVFFDWTATLGVFGLAWVAWLVWRSTRLFDLSLDDDRGASDGGSRREAVRAIVLMVAAVGLASAFIERELATPAYAATRVLGLAGWIGASIGMTSLVRTSAGAWLAGAAGLAMVAHAQIEVTPVWVNAAPFFGVWFGVATVGRTAKHETGAPLAAEGSRHGVLSRSGSIATPVLPSGIAVGLGVWIMASVWVPVWRWESGLRSAAFIVRPGAELRTMLDEAVATQDRTRLERLTAEVSVMSGRGVPARAAVLDQTIDSIRLGLLEEAAEPLEQAVRVRPGHVSSRIERDRAYLMLAAGSQDNARKRVFLDSAHSIWSDSAVVRPRSVGLWDWRGVKSERLADLTTALGEGDFAAKRLDEAVDAWMRANALSPYAIRPAVRLMDLSVRMGDPLGAGAWAAEAIRREGLTGLDPIAGLTDAERARARSLLAD